jgi:cob(I)alamin adenosyltransferase
VDELNAFAGSARALAEEITDRNGRVRPLVPFLRRVQHELFNLNCLLATLPKDADPSQAGITSADVTRLEQEIDHTNHDLQAPRAAALSGSGVLNGCTTPVPHHLPPRRAGHSLSRAQEPVPPEAIQ